MGNRIDNSWIILFGFMVICKLFDHDYYISVEQSNLVMKKTLENNQIYSEHPFRYTS
jgi:hypothetical protein